jgi:hypothetical protein
VDTFHIYKKIRQGWSINPKERIKDSDKKFNRSKAKKQFKKELQKELDV